MSINFSDTLPAAPAGSTNVKFQRDVSGNVSAYITTPAELTGNSIDLTAQAANIGLTPLVASPAAGLYRVSVYIVQSQVATTSGTLPSVVLSYKDKDSATVVTVTATATSSANVLGTLAQATVVLDSFAATTINYSTTGYASVGGTPLQYALHIRVETL
jgi:hypothetical protein